MTSPRLVCIATASLLASAGVAAAEEQTLQFRLVTQQVGQPTDLPAIGGHELMAGRYMGVAVFADGRIAHKRFVGIEDVAGDAGTFKGYSTYTFQNGDSLTLAYTGKWDGEGLLGEYRMISGTGAYEGATGTGSFTMQEEPWDEAYLYEGTIKLTLATQ